MARVESDGDFSRFEGVNRTLLVADSAGVTLRGVDGAPIRLTADTPPFAFAGELSLPRPSSTVRSATST